MKIQKNKLNKLTKSPQKINKINTGGNSARGISSGISSLTLLTNNAFNTYKKIVESDGGQIINEEKTYKLLESHIKNDWSGITVSPYAGVRLVDGFVDKAYCMVPYNGSFLDWTQPTAASRPEQVGEEWSFDGVDDFLSVDIGDHPTQFTAFAKIPVFSSGGTDMIIGTMVEGGSAGSRWHMTEFSDDTLGLSTFTGSGVASSVSTPHNGNNYIFTVDDDTVELFKDGVSTGSDTGSSINPAGNTEVRIGVRNNNTRPFPSSIEGATGLVTSVLTPEEVEQLNFLL